MGERNCRPLLLRLPVSVMTDMKFCRYRLGRYEILSVPFRKFDFLAMHFLEDEKWRSVQPVCGGGNMGSARFFPSFVESDCILEKLSHQNYQVLWEFVFGLFCGQSHHYCRFHYALILGIWGASMKRWSRKKLWDWGSSQHFQDIGLKNIWFADGSWGEHFMVGKMGSQHDTMHSTFVRYIGFEIETWSWCDSHSECRVRILIEYSLHTLGLIGLFRIYLFFKVWIRWGVMELYLLYTIHFISVMNYIDATCIQQRNITWIAKSSECSSLISLL